MEVDLSTNSGSVNVVYPVEGHITRQEVKGVIGSGDEGRIYAHTKSGNIDLIRH